MRLLTFLTIFCISVSASAATVNNLYDVAVPVADQTEESRSDAIGGAFQRMLVRLSGTEQVLENPVLMGEQGNAQSYMSSLRYERGSEEQLLLSVTFMAGPMQKLLERAAAPVWGSSRPRTQIWLAVNSDDGRTVVGPEESQWKSAFDDAMRSRGLPWMFPAWDLEDQMALPVASLWGLFEEDINSAAARYSSDGYVAGRIMALGSSFSFTGYINHADIRHSLSVQADTPELLASGVAGEIAEKLSERYAVIPLTGIDNSELIRVTGVTTFADYRALLEYLSANVAVRDVVVVASDRDEVTLALDLTTSWSQVLDSMALDKKITANEEGVAYVWQR